MNAALIALELRKNRLTLIGLALGFVLVPPLSLLVAPRAGYGPAAAVEAGLVLWTLAGLPLAAVVLGASAGAGLRAEATREAEEPFPVSAASRARRGLAAAALQFLILAAATALISAAVSPGWRGTVLGAGEAPEVWAGTAPLRGFCAGACLDLLVSSFLCAYALGHAFAGGLLGAALAAAECAALALGLQYDLFFSYRLPSFVPLALSAWGAGLAAKTAVLPFLAETLERRRRAAPPRLLAAGALVLAGLVLAAGAEEIAYARLRASLKVVAPSDGGMTLLGFGPTPDDLQADLVPAVYARGVPAGTAAGGLVWIGAFGRVTRLIPDAAAGRLIGPEWGASIEALHRDALGRIFVVRDLRQRGGDRRELWAGRPGAGLRRLDLDLSAFSGLALDGGRVVLKRGGAFFDPRGPQHRHPDCVLSGEDGKDACVPPASTRPLLSVSAGTIAPGSARGAARVSASPGRAALCRLPGRVPKGMDGPFPAFLLGGSAAWFIPYEGARGQGVALCREDGSARVAWRMPPMSLWPIGGPDLSALPDGSVVRPFAYDWSVATADGRFLPTITSRRLFQRWPRPDGAPLFTPRLLRRANGRDWVLFEGKRLVEMSESDGSPVRDWVLPIRPIAGEARARAVPLNGGFLLREPLGKSPLFVSWDGAVTRPRAP